MTDHGHAYRPLEWTDESVGRFWRWQAQYPQTYFTFNFGDRIVRRLRRYLAGRQSILDYGCGGGFLVPHLARLGGEVTATDYSAAAVEATNTRNATIARFKGACSPAILAASGRRFEAILAVEVIEHLSEEHLGGFFDAFRQLLTPDGIVVITTPNEEKLQNAEIYCPCCDQIFHRWQHLRSWSVASLKAAVEANGLAAIETFTTDFSWRPLREPVTLAKRIVKRLIGWPIDEPHLVCVARLKS
jgi:2-polyprenyl-3-methyl-5-hydroxy-6-metoxy-1,4-benzoquinol methylase